MPPSATLPRHIRALDGVRGLAIALVFVSHCIHLPLHDAARPGNWQNILYCGTNLALTGVELFFVLSGFLITRILLENLASPRLLSTFYSRRACRILPLYFLVVAAAFAAAHLLVHDAFWARMFNGQHPWQYYATFTQNIVMGLTGIYGGDALDVTWSLAVEEQFYLVLPLVIVFTPREYLPWLFAAGVPVAYMARMHFHDARSYAYAISHADSLLTGCLLSWICLQPAAYAWLRRQGPGLTLLLALLGAGVLLINQMPDYFNQTTGSWLAFFFGTLVLLVVTQPRHFLTQMLEFRPLCFLGTISYGVYLMHFTVQNFLFWFMRQSLPTINTISDIIFPIATFALSIALASLSWYLLEKPFARLAHRATY